jgi:[ribosomal protein S5]-alanine N-acetyltransferase
MGTAVAARDGLSEKPVNGSHRMITGDRLPTLEAPRLRLRWLTMEDAPALFEVFSDPEVTRYWSTPAWTAPESARRLVADIHDGFARRALFQWGIVRHEDARVVGTCTLSSIDAAHRRAELGYALARAGWGSGLAREAVRRVLAFAFDELDLHRVEADVDPRNLRSIALLERLGFKLEGHLRERWHVNGEVCDGLFYGLLRHEWRASSRS